MRNYAIAASFESFSNEGKELVIQYQAKYEKELMCGGGYLKIGPKQDDLTTFGEPTPYNIMFGPDQCNTEKRTHLIFSYNGKHYLKKKELPYKQEGEGMSHLYRLVVQPNNTVRVEVDQEQVYEGSLYDDWEMLPARNIDDPDDKKPADWVDDTMMQDPEDKKPADWVDEKLIVATKSDKPVDWDDDEDGEWEPPKIDNPAFKGEWAAKRISNPAYKGSWQARQIANPEFTDSPDLYKYDDFGFVGFDVWQVKGGTIFDNIIITDDTAEADEFATKWKISSEAEKEMKKTAEDAQAKAFEKAKAARAARAAAAKAAEEQNGTNTSKDENSTVADKAPKSKKKASKAKKPKDKEEI
jgi:calreticulin